MDRDPKPWIAALRTSHDRLKGLVGPLVPDGVGTPSLATEWTVADVLSHLGSQAEIFQSILDAALAGAPLPGPEAFPPVWDAWNAKSGEDQVSDSVSANEAFVRAAEGLSDAQLAALRFPMFGMDLDVAGFLQMRLSEHAMHSWDVAGALDPAAVVPADAVDLVIDTLPEMVKRIGKPQDKPFRVQIITSAPDRDLVLVVEEAVTLGPSDGGSADGVVRLPAEAWLRLVYGRLDDEHTPPLEIEGEGLTLDRLRAVFPGF
jgi:uncharacterized protein (TIGR03083 family)